MAVEALPDGKVRVTLSVPLEEGKQEVTELTFRPVRARHLESLPVEMSTMRFRDMLDLAGKLCGKPPKVMGDLAPVDLKQVMEVVGGFLSDFLPTGEEDSSPSPSGTTGPPANSAS